MNKLYSSCYRNVTGGPQRPKTVALLNELSRLTHGNIAQQADCVKAYWATLRLPVLDEDASSPTRWEEILALAAFLSVQGMSENFIRVVNAFDEFPGDRFARPEPGPAFDVIVGASRACPALKNLELTRASLTPAHQSALITSPWLEELTLNLCEIAPGTVLHGEAANGSSNLRSLVATLPHGMTGDMTGFLCRLGSGPWLSRLFLEIYEGRESMSVVTPLLEVIDKRLDTLTVRTDPPDTIIELLHTLASPEGRRNLEHLDVEGRFFELSVEDKPDLLDALCAMLKATPSLKSLRIRASFTETALDVLLDLLEGRPQVTMLDLVHPGPERAGTAAQWQRLDALRPKHEAEPDRMAGNASRRYV